VPAMFPVAASPNSTLCRREVVVVAAVEVGTVVSPAVVFAAVMLSVRR
jgi:hypothetical protein